MINKNQDAINFIDDYSTQVVKDLIESNMAKLQA